MSKVKATTSWYYSTVIVHCTVLYQYITGLATAAHYEQTEREWSCVYARGSASQGASTGILAMRAVAGNIS